MPLPVAAGLAIGAGAAGLMNSIIGSASNANLNSTNRRWQEEQSTVNYLRQRKLIEDSPALQKQGLINAGMSPAALGGYNGPSSSVSSASGPSGQFSPYVPLDAGQVVDAYLAMKQGEVADSQVNKNNAEANKANEEAGVVKPLADAQIQKLQAATKLDGAEIDKIAAQVPLLQSQGDYWRFAATIEDAVAQQTLATKPAEIDALMSQYKLSKAQADEAYNYVHQMAQASFELVTSEVYNNRAQGSATLSNATTNRLEYDLDVKRVKLQKMGVDADVALKGAQQAYQDALKGAVPSQIAANKAAAEHSKSAAANQRAQSKKTDVERKFMPLDYLLKGANTYFNGINAVGGVFGRAIPFLGR